MTIDKLISGCIVFAVMTWPAMAASEHYPIGTEQIAATVARMGVQIAPSQVTLLTEVVASTPNPALQVQFLQRYGADRFMVRLECESKEDCLPFIASVHVGEGEATQLAAVSSRMSLLKEPFSSSVSGSRPESIVIRSGSSATLLLDGGHVHIRIPVTCLENGSTGQTIRATDKDRRRVYKAQVVANGVLQGRL